MLPCDSCGINLAVEIELSCWYETHVKVISLLKESYHASMRHDRNLVVEIKLSCWHEAQVTVI